MRLSLLVRTAAMCCAVGLGTAGARAQSGYATSGGEFAIAGALPGDQVRPALSLNASGGFLVWSDNAICPHGLGVAALALDNTLHGAGNRFRVNKIGLGDQENPQVAVFNGGGAAFVWQGGRQGFQHIYGRFLSTSNTWATEDQLISSTTNRFQRTPAIASLSGGNAVVIWSSFNQAGAGSFQDVYGQVLTPTGGRVGGEFQVNQFTAFNQRSAAVAGLSGGGFVVVWVSELQRSGSLDNFGDDHLYSNTNSVAPTVDVYARLFDANGVAQGNEFRVNTSSSLCAHPSVAAAADGGFVVVWAEKDGVVKPNGWDVFGRVFSSTGTGGAVSRVNSYLPKDQYAPQVSNLGTNYFVVWTSVGQDGSREGIYGQFLQADGSPVGAEVRVNTATFGRQVQPTVASDGAGQFLAVWAGYSMASHSQDLFAQGYSSAGFVPSSPGQVFAAPPVEGFIDVVTPPGTGPLPPTTLAGLQMPFPGTGSLLPLTNAVASMAGKYNGMFYDTNGVSVLSAGLFSAQVTTRSAYSAKLLLGGHSYSVSGTFDSTGHDSRTVKRSGGLSPLRVDLQLVHVDGAGDQMRGTVTDAGNWQAQVLAARLVFNRTSNKALSYAGKYTMLVPSVTGGPDGSGYGTFTVDVSGNVRCTAALADGSKLTQASGLTAQGYWPLFASLYKGKGLIASWADLTPGSWNSQLMWIKPLGAVAPLFVRSFTNLVDAAISPYKGTAVSRFRNGNLSLSGGGGSGVTKALVLDTRGKSVSPATTQLNVVLNPGTGLFRGTTSLLTPLGGKISFTGVVLENGGYGAGFFQKQGVSGQVYWSVP